MQNSRRLFAYSPWLALTATLSLAGCGSDGSSSSTGSTESTAAGTPTTAAEPTTAAQTTSTTADTTTTTAKTPTTAAKGPTSPFKPPTSPSPLPTPSTSNATLSWLAPTKNTNGTALTDLRGYKIYYGTSAKQLNQQVALSNPGIQTYVVDGLSVGVRYYFTIAALASDGTESVQSPVVSETIS
jgi:hypothetical protein